MRAETKKNKKVLMTETFVQTCWIQEFKFVFFSKNVGKENFESNHLSKYTFNYISNAVSSSSTSFLSVF